MYSEYIFEEYLQTIFRVFIKPSNWKNVHDGTKGLEFPAGMHRITKINGKIQKLRTDLAHGDLSSRIGGSGICGSKTGAILHTVCTLSSAL